MNLLKRHWRGILARLPLPMLAIPASYGVYEFTALFVPWWVAVIQAAAFETVYVGLAAYDDLSKADKWRALAISGFAVLASIAYNTLAGMFRLDESLLQVWKQDIVGVAVLSALHGVPLALLAFLVSNFTLHGSTKRTESEENENLAIEPPAQVTFDRKRKAHHIHVKVEKATPEPPKALTTSTTNTIPILTAAGLTAGQIEALRLKREGLNNEQIGARLGVSAQAASSRINNAIKTAPKAVKTYLAK